MKVAFLDRDGTINRDYPDEKWKEIDSPEFLTDSIKGLKRLKGLGYELIIVTNQYIINDGAITYDQYNSFTEKLLYELDKENVEILDVFYCRHSASEKCGCMKPERGMFDAAIMKYENIDVNGSLMIGDSECDKIFAQNVSLRFLGISGGSLTNQDECYPSIHDAVNSLD